MSEIVTVGGLPGSGTSTLCRLLKEMLGVPYVYAGQIFRQEAADRGLTLAEFGALCEADDSVDRALDDKQKQLLRDAAEQEGLVLEGRLSGWLAQEVGVDALRIWVHCDEDERIRRIVERDGGDQSAQRQATLRREDSESARYHRYYGINMGDMTPYHVVLDSTHKTPEALAADVIAALRSD